MPDKFTLDYNDSITLTHPDSGDRVELFRVVAQRDFKGVRKGQSGGYIENYHNLSQEGNCWVADDAVVFDRSVISGDLQVCDNAIVYNGARISDGFISTVGRNAVVDGAQGWGRFVYYSSRKCMSEYVCFLSSVLSVEDGCLILACPPGHSNMRITEPHKFFAPILRLDAERQRAVNDPSHVHARTIRTLRGYDELESKIHRRAAKIKEAHAERAGDKFDIILNDTITVKNEEGQDVTLYRVSAMRDFISPRGKRIPQFHLGGYIEKPENLSQFGNAWVGKGGIVMGDAFVYGNAYVGRNVTISGGVKLGGHIQLTSKTPLLVTAENQILRQHAEVESLIAPHDAEIDQDKNWRAALLGIEKLDSVQQRFRLKRFYSDALKVIDHLEEALESPLVVKYGSRNIDIPSLGRGKNMDMMAKYLTLCGGMMHSKGSYVLSYPNAEGDSNLCVLMGDVDSAALVNRLRAVVNIHMRQDLGASAMRPMARSGQGAAISR